MAYLIIPFCKSNVRIYLYMTA